MAAGDLQRRLSSRAQDEVGELVVSINSMVKTLRDNYDELRTNDVSPYVWAAFLVMGYPG